MDIIVVGVKPGAECASRSSAGIAEVTINPTGKAQWHDDRGCIPNHRPRGELDDERARARRVCADGRGNVIEFESDGAGGRGR